MTLEPYYIRRSALRMWAISMLGVPMMVVSIDLLTQRRLTNLLRDLLFRQDDTQLPELRETVWAWAMLLVGLVLVIWGLKELLAPTKVVVADDDGLTLRLRGPFQPPFRLAWDQIDDIGSGTVDDEGRHLPVLWIRTFDPNDRPSDAWGARPIDDRTLAVLTADFEVDHIAAAEGIGERAIAAARLMRERSIAAEEPSEKGLFDPDVLPSDWPDRA